MGGGGGENKRRQLWQILQVTGPKRSFLFSPPWKHMKEERANCHGQSTPFFLKLLPSHMGGQIKRGRSLRSLNMIAESKQRGRGKNTGRSFPAARIEDKRRFTAKIIFP